MVEVMKIKNLDPKTLENALHCYASKLSSRIHKTDDEIEFKRSLSEAENLIESGFENDWLEILVEFKGGKRQQAKFNS